MSSVAKTVDLEIHLTVPEDLAEELRTTGLLEEKRLESLLRRELRMRRVDELFAAADRLATVPGPTPTAAEIESEIEAARRRRRPAHAGRR